MSQRERDVLKVMAPVLRGDRTQSEAARLLGRSVRTVRRIQRRLESNGDTGVIHGLRGRESNHGSCSSYRAEVLRRYRESYGDFGPTFASEKLAEEGLEVVPETLRRWLIAEGLWTRKRRRKQHRQRRPRRECFGELLQADGSEHDWLEGRGESMELLVLIDDATNRILARFYPGETTEAYLDLLGRWLRKYGRPLSFYADRHSIFQSQDRDGFPAGPTQFGRALEELSIELIPAYSPEAKGRVERFFGTAQDRWVKELRLAGVTTREGANELLESELMPEYEERCAKRPASPNDAHRPLDRSHNPSAILSVQERRVVSRDYVVRCGGRYYQLHKPALPGLRGGQVIVEQRLDGTLAIRFQGKYLKYHEIDAEGRTLTEEGTSTVRLAHWRPLADAGEEESNRADAGSTRSSATRPADGRSGCSPAEPYPPGDTKNVTAKGPYRPPADHPWRRTFLSCGK